MYNPKLEGEATTGGYNWHGFSHNQVHLCHPKHDIISLRYAQPNHKLEAESQARTLQTKTTHVRSRRGFGSWTKDKSVEPKANAWW